MLSRKLDSESFKRTAAKNSPLCVADRRFNLSSSEDDVSSLTCLRRGWCSGESEVECVETCHHITGTYRVLK